jgi:hypothetical protein
MERAAGTPFEVGSVEEDARAIDHPRTATRGVREDAAVGCGGMELESRGLQRGGERADEMRLVLTVEIRAERATSVAECSSRLGKDPKTPSTPDAGPVGSEERSIEPPEHLARRNLRE